MASFLWNQKTNYFQDLKQHFLPVWIAVLIFALVAFQTQTGTNRVAAGSGCRCRKTMKKVWSQRREVRPHPGLPAACRLAVLAAAWAIAEPCSFGPRPGPQQSLHLICICLSLCNPKVLFHVNGLEAGAHFFQKVFCQFCIWSGDLWRWVRGVWQEWVSDRSDSEEQLLKGWCVSLQRVSLSFSGGWTEGPHPQHSF